MKRFDTKPEPKLCSCKRGWSKIMIGIDKETEDDYYYYATCELCDREADSDYAKQEKIEQRIKEADIHKIDDYTLTTVDPRIIKLLDSSCYIYSDPGKGKTYSMIAHFKSELEKGKDCAFVNVCDLLTRIKSSYKPNPKEYESDIIEYYSTVKTLYLDDLGAEKMSDFVSSTFYAIIDKRYRKELRTIISSNLDLNGLVDHVGIRTFTRIEAMCQPVLMNGKNWRLTSK